MVDHAGKDITAPIVDNGGFCYIALEDWGSNLELHQRSVYCPLRGPLSKSTSTKQGRKHMGQRSALLTMSTRRLSRVTTIVLAVVVLYGLPSFGFAADKSVLLTEVHFDPGSTTVTPGGRQKIKQAIAALKQQRPREVRVIGFSDSTGGEETNRKISRSRADNVARLLSEQGVNVPLVVEGKGEKGAPYKIEDNVSEPLNRCVGIIAVGASEKTEPML